MGLFFEILLCAFAVFGLWCAMRLLCEACLGSKSIRMAIVIDSPERAAELPQLIDEARAYLSCRRGDGLVVLCDAALGENGEIPPLLTACCQGYGVPCRLVGRVQGKSE